jgi:hypothetical protein
MVVNTERKMRKVVIDSLTDVCREAQNSAQGKSAGGTLIEGRIPVVTADLINSFTSEVGSLKTKGHASYAVALAGFDIGETATFSWDIDYAARVNYGFTGTDSEGRTYNQSGWFFLTRAVEKWPQFVASNVKKVHNI